MISKDEAKKEIAKLVKKFESYPKTKIDSMSEEDIKFQFIEPLFWALGWKREEISKETRILKGRADYIFRIGNQESLVVEAKKTNVRLLEEQGRQAVSYAYHRKIKFSVLTNFKYLCGGLFYLTLNPLSPFHPPSLLLLVFLQFGTPEIFQIEKFKSRKILLLSLIHI